MTREKMIQEIETLVSKHQEIKLEQPVLTGEGKIVKIGKRDVETEDGFVIYYTEFDDDAIYDILWAAEDYDTESDKTWDRCQD